MNSNTSNIYKSYFDEFEIENVVSDGDNNYHLFEKLLNNPQLEQFKIFDKLENKLPLYNASSFGNQVHFQNAYQTPVQRWYPYREGYSVRLVDAFIKELKIERNIFDPFSGSGTTLLASRINKLNSFGIDVNPISVLVSKVENEQYELDDIEMIRNEINNLNHFEQRDSNILSSFELAKKMFNENILQSLLQIKLHIKSIKEEKIRNLFFVAWLAIIEEVSNVKKEGNGIKYKNRKRTPTGYINIEKNIWEKTVFPEDKFNFVKSKLLQHLYLILTDIIEYYGNNESKPTIIQGSCLEFDNYFKDEIQFTFTSPPYVNCFDYFEIHKVELWLGDFVNNSIEFRTIRNTGFRSNTNSLNQKKIKYCNHELENLIKLFDIENLWSLKIPDVIRGYFDDFYTLLKKLYDQTENNGYIGIVVGNSAYSGVIIPTDILIANIGLEIGFKVNKIFVTRHLTTSSQQKMKLENLKTYLRESIVLLEK